MSIIILIITLIPFDFRVPQQFKISWATNRTDFINNIFLFIPIGFLFKLSRGHRKDTLYLAPFLFGLILSMTIEGTQAFIQERFTQAIDVTTNGLGAWLGGFIYVYLKGRLSGERSGRLLALELPLMSLLYLLIPLIWLSGLGTGREIARLWIIFYLGIFGGCVLSSIYIYRLRELPAFSAFKLSLAAMGWFYISALTVLVSFPCRLPVSG